MTDPYYADDSVTLYAGDCLDVLRELPDASVDAVVTDPPYGLEFMGRAWDSFGRGEATSAAVAGMARTGYTDGADRLERPSFMGGTNPRCRSCGKWQRGGNPCACDEPDFPNERRARSAAFGEWCEQWAAECLRALKPGGHMLAFGGTRTWHRLACAIEDAGFEVRDSIAWLYGSGFPKSLDVSKAIDRAAGAEREVVGERVQAPKFNLATAGGSNTGYNRRLDEGAAATFSITAPATDDARTWQGWGTALKPAFEPVVVARKPLDGTVAANVLRHGTGALNIDATRIAMSDADREAARVPMVNSQGGIYGSVGSGKAGRNGETFEPAAAGRWPANVVLDESQAAELDRQSGVSSSAAGVVTYSQQRHRRGASATVDADNDKGRCEVEAVGFGETGGASRFFPTFRYEAKAPTAERPRTYHPSCECENSWPTTSRARATDATTAADDSSTSRSGSSTTDNPSPTDTTSTTSTGTSSTTTPRTSSRSRRPNTSDSTPAANSETASGGNPAASAASSSPSESPTGTSAAKGGRSTVAAVPATSREWSATSVCGSCGAPARSEAHATVKPLDLMRWLVRLVTPPGGVVLEPFAGSGTTAEACVIEGFRCIAIEREADYLPLIVQRLTKPIQPTLFGGDVA